MDLAQLRNGSIVYSPQTADISFKMEVTGKDDSKTASESVRVLRTRPSPLQEQPGAQANGAAKPAATAPVTTPTPTPASATANTPPTSTPVAQTPDPNAQPETKPVVPTRSFNASTLSARLRPAQTNDLPDAPAVAGGAVPSAIPGVNLNAVTARPNAPVPPPAAPAAPTPTPQGNTSGAKSGGQIQSAVLISKKDPEYPKLARQTGARGQVKLTATVGKDGHVKSVKVISGHPMLQAAAVDAVKQWVYKPTLLNGQAVETDTDIVLNFVGDR
jgi:protein TonB